MRLVSALYLLCTIALHSAMVLAGGPRGAMEKIIYFSAYVQEEIFTSPDDFTIAPGCTSGTRKGLRGQEGRCTFPEFLEYIWKRDVDIATGEIDQNSEAHIPSDLPWDKDIVNITKTTPEKMFRQITSYFTEESTGRGDEKVVTWPGFLNPGFTGAANRERLLPGSTMTYYEYVGSFGEKSARANQEFERLMADPNNNPLTETQQADFQKWRQYTQDSINMGVDLRLKDKWARIKKPSGWKVHMRAADGTLVPWIGIRVPTKYPGVLGSGGWEIPDWNAMAQQFYNTYPQKFGTVENAREEMNARWEKIKNGDKYAGHQSAIAALKKNQVSLGCSYREEGVEDDRQRRK